MNANGMPSLLQLALTAQEFSDVIVFRKPPPALQRAAFGALGAVARRRGYRATYVSLSRTTLGAQGRRHPGQLSLRQSVIWRTGLRDPLGGLQLSRGPGV